MLVDENVIFYPCVREADVRGSVAPSGDPRGGGGIRAMAPEGQSPGANIYFAPQPNLTQTQGRGSRGAVGATCPKNLEAVGAPHPQLWTVNVIYFYFCLFLHMDLDLSQK